jgi:hypothetical protein
VLAAVGPNIASASVWKRSQTTALAPAVPATPAGRAAAPSSTTSTPPASASAASDLGPGGKSHAPTGGTVPSGVDLDAGVPGVAPPTTIADNCSADVSGALQTWLTALPPGTLVRPPASACYRVDRGITLSFPQGLTIDGGTYKNTTTEKTFTGHSPGRPTFNVIGGSAVTFEDLTIRGANPGGYHRPLAFEGGIELQGTAQAVVRNLAIDHVYGDGISLEPLRGGGDHMSGAILAATKDLTIDTVDITGSGRQGIGLVSVDTATIDNVALRNVGISSFDFEADEAKEGARNVTIDGCTSSTWNGGTFFANAGASAGAATSNITVENCRMLHPQGGDAVLVTNAAGAHAPRGPITFADDTLWCGASTYVGCFELTDAKVSVTQSVIQFPKENLGYAELFHAAASTLALVDDSVRGWTHLGQHRASSTISVSGGSWIPAYDPATAHSIVTVSHADLPSHIAHAAARDAAVTRRRNRHRARH